MNCMNISYLARNCSRGLLFYRFSLSRPYSEQGEPRWTSFRRIRLSSDQPQEFHGAGEVGAERDDESTFDSTNVLKRRGLRSQAWDSPNAAAEPPGGPNPSLWARPTGRSVKLKGPAISESREGGESSPIYVRESTRPVVPEENGNKNLLRAVDPWNEEEVKKVLEKGNVDINCRNYSGMTPLHRAAQQNLPEAVKTLLKFGADVTIMDNKAFTPLQLAVEHKAKMAIPALLAAGSDPDTQSDDGETPLTIAIKRNSDYIVKLLLNAHATVNPREGTKTPPVHLAARLRRKAILSLFMKANPKLDLRDALGRTPLHHAAERDEYKGVYMLLERRPGIIDIQDYEGNTALHLALGNDCQTTTAMLIQMGADYTIPNPEGGVMDEMLVDVAFDKLVRFRGIPGMKTKYYGPFPKPRPVKRIKTAIMGVGDDWADRMAEEKEAARLRKKELREVRLGKHKEIKDKWKSPFVFEQGNPPSE
ncbi:ankyrin repeat-containing domain protein, partial [Morchella snyderi]